MELPDFDLLLQLARERPDQLEALRQRLVADTIEQAAPAAQRRLAGLQFQIDAQRQLHDNPLGRCVKLSAMMHASVHSMLSLLHQEANVAPARTAKILPFPGPRKRP